MSRSSTALPVCLPLLTLLALLTPRPAAAQPPDPDPWFGPDKALHFTVSALITGGGYGTSTLLTDKIPLRIAFGASLGITAGVAKELFDLAGFGHPSFRDLAWDVFGTAVGVGLSVAIDVTTPSSPSSRTAPAH